MNVEAVKARGWRAAATASRAVGRITAGARMRPDFLIVGAQRCGTTSMFKALAQHPGVLPPAFHKGVHYFDTAYHRPRSWYDGHFPTRIKAAAVARRLGHPVLTGESSPFYMFHPLAPVRISVELPEVKLLVLLRDPVERAYSAHAHETARGFETEPLERALELERQRLTGERERMLTDPGYVSFHIQHHAYVNRGRYVEQLEHLVTLFGRDRIHVLDSDDFFCDPEPEYAAVCDFLGLPQVSTVGFRRHNARPRSPMPASLRARLEEYFAPFDQRLAAWWGRTPSWRR
jgi:hypothetical protein